MLFNEKDFCKKIIELRKSHDMSQRDLGELLKLERSTISYYESGKVSPSLDALVKIASIFNVSTDYLLGVSVNTEL